MVTAVKSFFSSRPYIFSILIILAVVAWMASGQLQAEDQSAAESAEPSEHAPVRVQVMRFSAEAIEQSLNLYGRTEARRESVISAEVSGRLLEFLVRPGREVKKGQALARLDVQDREDQLQRAKVLLEQRTIQYEGVRSLNEKGFQGKVGLAEARSALVEAEALVTNLSLAVENTLVLAPYAGVFNDNMVEAGAYLGVGDPILQMSDTSTLVVRTDVSERDIGNLQLGDKAYVTLVGGEELEGFIDFIATVSDPNTLTFRVEVEVDNSQRKFKAGSSARVRFPLKEVEAIKVTPAVLALDDEGTLGVKTVVDGLVQFVPAELVRSEPDGAWLSGFSGENDVIVLGQGFVRAGDKVQAVATAAEMLPSEVN